MSCAPYNVGFGIIYIEEETEAETSSGGMLMLNANLAVEYYLQRWWSLGPRIDLTYGTYNKKRYYSTGYGSVGYTYRSKSAFILDLLFGMTLHI